MTESIDIFERGDRVLATTATKISDRLQPGIAGAAIAAQTAAFSWYLPPDAERLYRWHNGLAGNPTDLSLLAKLIRLKDKWHGELSGRENEIRIGCGDRRLVVKFLPLEYALAGHRHLKFGRCPIDLLPLAIVRDGDRTIYYLLRLSADLPIVYCANGTNLPPLKVTESFLSAQPQFSSLLDLLKVAIDVFERGCESSTDEDLDCTISPSQLARLYPWL